VKTIKKIFFFIVIPVGIIGTVYFLFIKNSMMFMGDHDMQLAATHYATNCASCHDKNLNEFIDREWQITKTESEMFNLIKNGNESIGMPSFSAKIGNEEIKSLGNHIQSAYIVLKFEDQIIPANEVHYSTLSTLRSYSKIVDTQSFIESKE
jgi:cytochrome c553